LVASFGVASEGCCDKAFAPWDIAISDDREASAVARVRHGEEAGSDPIIFERLGPFAVAQVYETTTVERIGVVLVDPDRLCAGRASLIEFDVGHSAGPALHIERPLLVGHSDGGSIALLFAGAFPEVPLGIAVLAPHEFVEEVTLVGIRAARSIWESTDWPTKLGRYHLDAVRVFEEWNDTWLSPLFRDWNIEQYLPKIRCPVLAIQGEDDEYATMRQIEVIAEQVPGTELLKLPNCGHTPQRDQEAAVLAALLAFVDRVNRAKGS